jgi:hypothetical protein
LGDTSHGKLDDIEVMQIANAVPYQSEGICHQATTAAQLNLLYCNVECVQADGVVPPVAL